MIKKLTFNHTIIFLIILVASFLRFYKLDWGDGYFFHPDEYHLVISASQLKFPDQLHPNLFSYGSSTVYLIYFTKLVVETLLNIHETSPFLIGRFYSALFSTLSVYIVYLISNLLINKRIISYTIAFSVAAMPGLIQQAHFATPESAITFWMLVSIYLLLVYIKKERVNAIIIMAPLVCVNKGSEHKKIIAKTMFSFLEGLK